MQKRAYIVDDDVALRKMIRRILADLHADVEEFQSAEDFLCGYSQRPLGCVLLDMRLPGISGLELLEQIAELPPANPVVMISGFGDIPSAVKAVQRGALDFIQKPFRKEQLVDLVNKAFASMAETMTEDQQMKSLTPREREVLKAFSGGAPNKIVAAELGLSPRTVEMHRARIFRKLGVTNLSQALLRVRDTKL